MVRIGHDPEESFVYATSRIPRFEILFIYEVVLLYTHFACISNSFTSFQALQQTCFESIILNVSVQETNIF